MEVNVTLRRGAGPAGIEGGIAAGPREDEAFDGPRFTTIKASPDGALFAGRFGSVNIAKNENVLAIDRKADEAARSQPLLTHLLVVCVVRTSFKRRQISFAHNL